MDTKTTDIALYDYPNESYSRVEGKSLVALEEEILAGGPFPYGRVARTYALAEDATHPLHFVAKYYLHLSKQRAQRWVLEEGQSLMPIPDGCTPKNS
jgi:hypothetical protein